MLFHDFSFNGQLASDMGVIVETQAEYVRPPKRVRQWTVPGRGGFLTQDEGEEAYDPVDLSPLCYLKPGADAGRVGAWLNGAGQLVLGSQPEFAYRAQIINQVPFSRLFQHSGSYMSFSPIFRCHPFRYHATPDEDLVYTQAGEIVNPGNVPARPRIIVVGTGDVMIQAGMAAYLYGLEDGVIIDSELEDCLTLDGANLINDKLDGEFPLIPPGTWQVTWTGDITKVTITPRWRWI